VATKSSDQPNMFVIVGDDLGLWNSCDLQSWGHEVGVGFGLRNG
jgi:hypothetical protein